jgi:hypothetical protein
MIRPLNERNIVNYQISIIMFNFNAAGYNFNLSIRAVRGVIMSLPFVRSAYNPGREAQAWLFSLSQG